jgi:two-component system response regulator YesN
MARETVASLGGRRKLSGHVDRVREFIRWNFRRRVKLEELAEVAGVTPNYLSHIFTRECGTTMVRFVNRLRVEEGARLLRESERNVEEIASLVGYQNYRDFHRNFVKRERIAPSAYRKRVSRRDTSEYRASTSRR